MAADRNVLIMFDPDLTLADQSALALRIHMMWSNSGADTDDYMGKMVVWGNFGDIGDEWISALNESPHLVAIEMTTQIPLEFGYKLQLDLAARDGVGNPTIKFMSRGDWALAKEFCPEIPDDLTCTVIVGDGVNDDNEYELLSIDSVLGKASLNLRSRVLTIFPTWKGHKHYLRSDRLTEYE